jgi:hypothetical protein
MSANPKESWWTPWQLALAEDYNRKWEKRIFTPTDAVKEKIGETIATRKLRPGESNIPKENIIHDGWNHEHCRLCWKTISPQASDEHMGYVDKDDWLCESCWERYIADARP